jgi:formamidopyrimidine-DNA glycosylase
MPELPEVETLCRQLRRVIVGAEISQTQINDQKLGTIEGIEGKQVCAIHRHGKALAIQLQGDLSLLFHLRMTGRLLWQQGNGLTPHVRLVISCPQGKLFLIDPRRFATVRVHQWGEGFPLGSDPLDEMNPSHLWSMAQRSTLPVKSFLMDQRRIAGIGNIYACEILHQTRMDPWRRVNTLSHKAWGEIGEAARKVLSRAIACRGTSISDWRDLFGEEGNHKAYLRVYGREGAACYSCQGTIRRRKLNGRGTYYCPVCQHCEGG